MLFIALVNFKTTLTKETVARNMKDIEEDTKCQVRSVSMYWTLGRYDTVVIVDAPDEKVAMHVILKRADRMYPLVNSRQTGRTPGRTPL